MNPTEPFTAPQILEALNQAVGDCTQLCETFSSAEFQKSHDGKWSPAQNLEHLIKSTKPLTQGLGMPSLALKAFGKPNRPVRDYAAVVARYQEKLAAGGRATSGYEASEAPASQAELLTQWTDATRKLAAVIQDKWMDEAKLERYLLPHPLLGKLLVREMLFFTVYHTQHHIRAIRHQHAFIQ